MMSDDWHYLPPAPRGAPEPSTADPLPTIPSELPVLPLKDTVVYPLSMIPLAVGQERSLRLIEAVAAGDRLVGLVAQFDAGLDNPGPDEAYRTGTVGVIHQLIKVPDGTLRLAVQGLERMRIIEYTATQPYLRAHVEVIPDREETGVEVDALMRSALDLFERLVQTVPYLPDELLTAAINVESPRQLVYLIASSLRIDLAQRQELLETDSTVGKLTAITTILSKELEVVALSQKIQSQVEGEFSKNQREYFLREQLKAIQHELGEADETQAEINTLRERLEVANLPAEARQEAFRELDRLSKLPPAAAEYGVIRTYLDWMASLPWAISTEGAIDIARARAILDRDHYDLKRVKDRIVEYLAVRQLRRQRVPRARAKVTHLREPILCLVGPPGVGKTSLGHSIAEALGRHFTRMSLGGIRDEAEVRGHRRTYVGAMPGRIMQAIRRAGSNDPVFMLDEVDKLGADWRGDPSSALLEVLDPEQNNSFRDLYLDVAFDLSRVMFIATANQLDPIPAPLRDRMEILTLPGYTEREKVEIARRYLLPKQMAAHALTGKDVHWRDDATLTIIQDYTREAGVRNLEREIASSLRKVAQAVAEGASGRITMTPKRIEEYLGPARFYFEAAARTALPGVATGLVVTPTGGDILFIEVTRMPGSRQLLVTGQLGDVMRESAQAALSYVRSRAGALGIDPDFLKESDIHVHVPAGAIPKDGPSAGITLATALVSLLTDRPVRSDIAMTGEITLRGQVLPIGGAKEKTLAAHRAGIRTVVLPRRNLADLEDLPPELRQAMTLLPVETVDEVLHVALTTKATTARRQARAKRLTPSAAASAS
jgi:ATP-dependent Lon protease